MDPTEESKLLTKILPLKICDEADEANNVKHEADESVVTGKGDEISVHKDNVLEVVDNGFAVEEVVSHDEEIPVDSLVPAVALLARGSSLGTTVVTKVEKSSDFFIDERLTQHDEKDHVGVAHTEKSDEAADHNKGPDRPLNHVAIFLGSNGFLAFFALAGSKTILKLDSNLARASRVHNISRTSGSEVLRSLPFPVGWESIASRLRKSSGQ